MHERLIRFSVCTGFAAILAMGISSAARAGQLATFEGTGVDASDPTFDFGAPHTNGYVPDGASGGAVLTPDNTTASQGSWSLRINTPTTGFHFGDMRWDHGAVNSHYPQWLSPNQQLLFDVKVGTFTDFLTIRPSFIPSGPTGAGGTLDGPDIPINGFNDGQWHTIAWQYPTNQVPNWDGTGAAPGFWIEWFSTNSNGPVQMWIDNIRTAPVPEPASAGLIAVGMAMALRRRRRPRA